MLSTNVDPAPAKVLDFCAAMRARAPKRPAGHALIKGGTGPRAYFAGSADGSPVWSYDPSDAVTFLTVDGAEDAARRVRLDMLEPGPVLVRWLD